MYKSMYQLLFVLAILLLSNSACRVKGEECRYDCRDEILGCMKEGQECVLDEECCTAFCDWKLSYYPFTGGCAPRPSGPLPQKPCIPLGSGAKCVYNVTCCRGMYCETRYTDDGVCLPLGTELPSPPSDSPAPIAPEIAPISAPIATPVTPAATPLPTDLAPILPPITPSYDVSVPAPTPAWSKNDGSRNIPVAPTTAPSKKDGHKHKPVAPTPAQSKKGGRKIKQKKKDKSGSSKCTKAHAPPPAY